MMRMHPTQDNYGIPYPIIICGILSASTPYYIVSPYILGLLASEGLRSSVLWGFLSFAQISLLLRTIAPEMQTSRVRR